MKSRIFAETWEQVWSGEKTVTSRVIKDTDAIEWRKFANGTSYTTNIDPKDDSYHICRVYNNGQKSVVYTRSKIDMPMNAPARTEWEVGDTFLMKPARTAPGIALLQVKAIEQADVLEANYDWAEAEGFESIHAFVTTYIKLNAPKYEYCVTYPPPILNTIICRLKELLGTLPCWKVRFLVVERYPHKLAKWQGQS